MKPSTLRALNARLWELLTDMNNRPMKGYGNQTRAERFRILDAPALSPLPLAPYEYTEYKAVKVGPDYHVEYARHWVLRSTRTGRSASVTEGGQSVVQLWQRGSMWRNIRAAHMNINTQPIRFTCQSATGSTGHGHRNA